MPGRRSVRTCPSPILSRLQYKGMRLRPGEGHPRDGRNHGVQRPLQGQGKVVEPGEGQGRLEGTFLWRRWKVREWLGQQGAVTVGTILCLLNPGKSKCGKEHTWRGRGTSVTSVPSVAPMCGLRLPSPLPPSHRASPEGPHAAHSAFPLLSSWEWVSQCPEGPGEQPSAPAAATSPGNWRRPQGWLAAGIQHRAARGSPVLAAPEPRGLSWPRPALGTSAETAS